MYSIIREDLKGHLVKRDISASKFNLMIEMHKYRKITLPFLLIFLILFLKSNEISHVTSETMNDINVLTILHPELSTTDFYGVVNYLTNLECQIT